MQDKPEQPTVLPMNNVQPIHGTHGTHGRHHDLYLRLGALTHMTLPQCWPLLPGTPRRHICMCTGAGSPPWQADTMRATVHIKQQQLSTTLPSRFLPKVLLHLCSCVPSTIRPCEQKATRIAHHSNHIISSCCTAIDVVCSQVWPALIQSLPCTNHGTQDMMSLTQQKRPHRTA